MATVFLTHIPDMLENYYGPRAVAALREMADVRINPTGQVLDAAGLAEHARGCEIVVSDRQTPGYAEFFTQAPDLVAFLRCAVDIRNVDVEAASRSGIVVTRATPGFGASVAEMALGFMVDLARHVSASVLDYRAGREPEPRMGRQLKGSVVGIIGYGVIAQHLAPIAVALGMEVLVADPYKTVADAGVRQVAFEELLQSADFVVCLAVATEETESLMNAGAFGRMKRGAAFINLSRGNLVDEAALEAALDEGRIAGQRDRFLAALEAGIPGVRVNGDRARRVAGNLNLTLPGGVDAQAVMAAAPGVCVSTGSACSSASVEPSYVLRALGLPEAEARATLRIGIGRFTSPAEVDRAAAELSRAWNGVRHRAAAE